MHRFDREEELRRMIEASERVAKRLGLQIHINYEQAASFAVFGAVQSTQHPLEAQSRRRGRTRQYEATTA